MHNFDDYDMDVLKRIYLFVGCIYISPSQHVTDRFHASSGMLGPECFCIKNKIFII